MLDIDTDKFGLAIIGGIIGISILWLITSLILMLINNNINEVIPYILITGLILLANTYILGSIIIQKKKDNEQRR